MTFSNAHLPGTFVLLLVGCGGGGSGDDASTPPVLSDETSPPESNGTFPGETSPDEMPDESAPGDTTNDPATTGVLPADAESASYSLRVESFWFIEDYPQGFPDNAHLSHIGGATHNAAVSFWDVGETISEGMEDVAESGRIDLFLDEEVRPAIENGTADSAIARREFIFSSPETFDLGLVNEATFDIAMRRDWPLVTLVTMLGPSPDWFVGVSGLPLYENGAWHDVVTVDLPLHDGGTKSSVEPIMGGPDIRPPIPIALIAYDAVTGTYQPTDTPQDVARLTFTRRP